MRLCDREKPWERSRVAGLELQPALTGALGERLHAPVILVSAPVKDDLLHPGRECPLGEQLTGPLGLLHRPQAAQIGLGPVDRGQSPAGVIVDQLGEYAAVGAEHRDAGALRASAHLCADAPAAPEAALGSRENGHARLPTLRATYSPS